MKVQVSKWGNSLGVRIPKNIALEVGLSEGTKVDVSVEDSRIVISTPKSAYTLPELLVGMTPEAMHETFDWGEDLGRENIP